MEQTPARAAHFPVRPPTRAEQRVLEHLRAGRTNREIAFSLGRSEATVKNQIASLLRKFRVSKREQLLQHTAGG